ncbi:MAG: hypothetical protein M3Q73_01375 [bacterium]|nr:hypothetical protein [bacterium]
MTKEKGKRITIDQLAEMMQRSFKHIEVRFERLEEKFDKRFDRLELKFDMLDSKVNINHENRISRVEDDLRVIKTRLENK